MIKTQNASIYYINNKTAKQSVYIFATFNKTSA